MREIKFRAFDKVTGLMVTDTKPTYVRQPPKTHVHQWTTIKEDRISFHYCKKCGDKLAFSLDTTGAQNQ